jgi:hypothetical protein
MVPKALSRRRLLVGTIASATALRFGLPALAATPLPKRPVGFKIPRCACDTHARVIEDPTQFPFSPSRAGALRAGRLDIAPGSKVAWGLSGGNLDLSELSGRAWN